MNKPWKVIFYLLIMMGIVCSFKSNGIAAGTKTTLNLSATTTTNTVKRGEEFTVKVRIDAGANLSGVNYEINYDQNQVQFMEYSPGEVFTAWENANQPDFFINKSSGFVKAFNSDTAGVVKVGAAGVNGTTIGGEFGIFKFKVNDSATNKSAGITLDVTSACQASHGSADEGNGITISTPAVAEVTVITDQPVMELSKCNMAVDVESCTYDGTAQKPEVVITDGNKTLREGKEYRLSYEDNISAGKATVKAIALENSGYTGSVSKKFIIDKASQVISNLKDSYNMKIGESLKLTPSLSGDGIINFSSSDTSILTVNQSGIVAALAPGMINVTISVPETANYLSATRTVQITSTATDLSEFSVTIDGVYEYTGNPVTPSIIVKNGNITLVNGTDYTVSYSNNVDAGTAKVTISGKGGYEGVVEKSFTIEKASQTIGAVISESTMIEGRTAQITASGIGNISFRTLDNDIVMVDSSGKIIALAKGSTEIIVTAEGNANYKSASKRIAVTVIEEAKECVHDWGTGKVTKQPTCIENGERIFTCSKCSETKTEKIIANGHNYSSSYTIDKEPSCTTEGSKSKHCTICGSKADIRTIHALGHKYVSNVIGNTRTYKCSVCGDHYSETLSLDNVEYVENALKSKTTDSDLDGATYSKLTAQFKKATNSSITIHWKRVSGAINYNVYAAKCNSGGNINKFVKVSTRSAGTTSYTYSGLAKGTDYKFVIMAVSGNKVLATSKTLHITTTGGKNTNIKSLKLNKTKVSIKKGKTFKVKVKKITLYSKKLKNSKHRANAFESSNIKIATVNSKGKIKGINKGSCTIYVYAQDGVYKSLKVTVK